MSAKDIKYDMEARERIMKGVDTLANAVKVTLGPKGRNVIIGQPPGFSLPVITKDGVTVANAIELEDRFENMGAQMVKEVASKTSDKAGDGTTTATLLAQAIFIEGSKLVVAGMNPMALKYGIDKGVALVVDELKKMSKKIGNKKEIVQIGTISANNDKTIGDMIAEAMEKVGKEGVITVEEAKGMETSLEIVEGMQFDRGYLSPYFVTDPYRMEVILENPYILIHEEKISSMQHLVPLLDQIAKTGRQLLIIADDVEGEALATLVINKMQGMLKCAVIKAPEFHDRRKAMLEDIAILTGGKVVSVDLGIKLENFTLNDLGSCKKVTIDKDHTTIVDGAGSRADIEERTKKIRAEIEGTKLSNDREKLQVRLARIISGVAVLKVGAATELDMKEKKARVEGALHATRAAVEEGIVPGGGVAFIRSISALANAKLPDEEQQGLNIVRRALEEPLRQIAANAGFVGSLVVEKVKGRRGAYGFNAETAQYGDMLKAGIIDPTKVARFALQNAASVASLMLTTEAMVAERPMTPSTAPVMPDMRG